MNRIIGLGYVLIVLVNVSCKKDWLEAKADKQQAIPATIKDFQALMDNRTAMNAALLGLSEVAADGHYLTEAAWTSATSAHARNAYTWTNELPYISNTSTPNWISIYKRVYYDNMVLDGVGKIDGLSAAEQTLADNLKGQALYNRSSAFWCVAQNYAPQFNEATAATDLGIPIRLGIDITEKSVRASVQETYDRIVDDLKAAVPLLTDASLFPTRANKQSAYGMLARVYLSMSQYDSAYRYADLCLKLPHGLLDYNTLSVSANFVGLFVKEVIYHEVLYTSGVSNVLTTAYLVDKDLFNSYADNDLRKTIYFKNTSGNITFKGNYYDNATELFAGLATDEVYLIRAECLARLGSTSAAMKDLNDLLRTRWKKNPDGSTTYVDQTAATADAALMLILSERRKELILRGLRWSDMRRLNLEDRFKLTVTRTIGGKTYTLEPGSYKYTFPIPDDIIQQTGMKQNVGWEE